MNKKIITDWIKTSLIYERIKEKNINITVNDFIYEVWAMLPYNTKSFIWYNEEEINTCVTTNKKGCINKKGYVKLLEIEPNTSFEKFLQIILTNII